MVRALEAAADGEGVRAGYGVAHGRIEHDTPLRVADAILTGIHQPGESHFELLRAFADDAVLDRVAAAVVARDYRVHEFGDSMLLERQLRRAERKDRRIHDHLGRHDPASDIPVGAVDLTQPAATTFTPPDAASILVGVDTPK